MEASVARCLRTPPAGANRQDLISVTGAALRGDSHRSIVVIRNYRIGPISAEPCRAKAHPLHPRRSYFAPAGTTHSQGWALVEAPGTAPGSERLITMAIYRHSRRETARLNIGDVIAFGKARHAPAGAEPIFFTRPFCIRSGISCEPRRANLWHPPLSNTPRAFAFLVSGAMVVLPDMLGARRGCGRLGEGGGAGKRAREREEGGSGQAFWP